MSESQDDKKAHGSIGDTAQTDYEVGIIHRISGELETIHVPGIDAVFEEQSALVNHAIQAIGMGKYQWALFGLAGYGWMCDQVSLHANFLTD